VNPTTAERTRAMDDREEKIRVRAYEIWERQGRSGDPEDHWLEAEGELEAEETPNASDSPAKSEGSRRLPKS
jgi:hypothetical protein